ncbi:RNA polymerase sigma-70 factor [soil metagenome]
MSDPEIKTVEKKLPVNDQQELKIFDVLFKTWFAPLCNIVNRLVRDKDVSQDLVQDVFLKTWNNRDNLDLSQPIKSYLFKAAVNTALNHLESHKIKFSIDLDSVKLEISRVGDSSVDHHVNYKEVQQMLEKSMDQLPPKCKAVFVLIKYEDMSYAEAAESLGISVKTVENQMGKALKHMRDHMQEYLGYLLSVLIAFGK